MIDEYLIRLEGHLRDIKGLLQKMSGVSSSSAEGEPDYLAEFAELKSLLASDDWPVAVEPHLICDPANMEQGRIRAESIMDFMIYDDLAGKKFLDFGCGNGLCAEEALNRGASSAVGYDIRKQWGEGETNALLTTSWQETLSSGPYDSIFVYDVLDHIVASTPENILRDIRKVCDQDTKIYVRCHPWCSRTGSHLYINHNKAYLHLIFSDIELLRMGIDPGEQLIKVIHPHLTYKTWFANTNFSVIEEHPYTETLEDFFKSNKLVSNRIKQQWKSSHEPTLASGDQFPEFQLRIQFLDFSLKIK